MGLGKRRLLALSALLVLFVGLCAAQPEAEGYRPVAPVQAVHAAVQANLKIVQDWLDEKDFASAAQAAQGLTALAHLYTLQGSKDDWRSKANSLADACSRLAATAKSKDAAGSAKQLTECRQLLDQLARQSPGPAAAVKSFKPRGGTKVWMLLMDSAYTDAKTAKTPTQMQHLAYALAEEMNATGYLRSDQRWRQWSKDVRAAALTVADKAKGNDLTAARAALKVVYQRCEACHQRSKK